MDNSLTRHFPRFHSSYLLLCSHRLTLSPLLLRVFPPERSFLAYAFPLLDMCKPRLTLLRVSIFFSHLSALYPPVCSYSFSLYVLTTTTTTFICSHLSLFSRRKKKA